MTRYKSIDDVPVGIREQVKKALFKQIAHGPADRRNHDFVPIPEYQQPKPNKYGAIRCEYKGMSFDSKSELTRYKELEALQMAGEVRWLERQVPFTLNVGEITLGRYIADYCYQRLDMMNNIWVPIVEDRKSPATMTPMAKWKMKHLKAEYGIEVLITGKGVAERKRKG